MISNVTKRKLRGTKITNVNDKNTLVGNHHVGGTLPSTTEDKGTAGNNRNQ